MPYVRRSFLIPAHLEEIVVAELWVAGTLGVQSDAAAVGQVCLEAYFLPGASSDTLDLPAGVEFLGEEEVPETDWLSRWREAARPFAVGESFFVDPREPDGRVVQVPQGRRLLRLPARAAFGTGSHESTSLAVGLLEEVDVEGKRVLDVGTGTGILAFAALARGAAEAVGFDVDPAAAFHARDNAALNGLAPRLFTGTAGTLRASPRFDLALVNMVPEEMLPELGTVVRRLMAGGQVILSGILRERRGEILERARALGLAEQARCEAGEWVAFRLALEQVP